VSAPPLVRDIHTLLPPEAERRDHTLVHGRAWEWTVTVPASLLDGRHGFALVLVSRANALLSPVHAHPVVIDAGRVRFSLSAAETATMGGSTYWYEMLVAPPDAEARPLAYGRVDLMSEAEYHASLRRVKQRITIPIGRAR
jgi:hypothetical protein